MNRRLAACLFLSAALRGDDFFETRIRPVLSAQCAGCHNATARIAGLDLTSAEAFARLAPARLLEAVSYTGKIKMPPAGKLPGSVLADLEAWVRAGAAWPVAAKTPSAETRHWAFEPVRDSAPPPVRDAQWPRSSVDRFLLAAMEAQGLRPAPPASKLALLRRASYDLTGLPPAPSEIEAYLADQSEDAFARVVERLLASPHYGEKWGRHWLDAARFADSTGMDEDHVYPHAWRYRDYVIGAFNRDLPYSRFVEEQLAGDLLPDATVATGFLALGPKPLAQQDRVKMIYDVVDEQIDTTSKAFLGLSVACARCHDHKFDPILTRDYYSLAAIFASTKNFTFLGKPGSVAFIYYAPLTGKAAYDAYLDARRKIQLKRLELEEALDRQLRPIWKEQRERISTAGAAQFREASLDWEKRLENWRNSVRDDIAKGFEPAAKPKPDAEKYPYFAAAAFGKGPFSLDDLPPGAAQIALSAELKQMEAAAPPEPPMASAVCEGDPVEQRVFIRGDHHNPGEPAPPAFPRVLSSGPPPAVAGSGRRELAQWLVDPAHPLTARVMVNRIWQGHFGEGLVRTPNNFGRMGERPTHPALLDHLARRFVGSGWSVKAMHRMLMLSSAYRMSADVSMEAKEKDPANRLWSHFNRRRLSVEEIRDSLLSADGSLDLTLGGDLNQTSAPENGKRRARVAPEESRRRTVYIPVRRGSLPALLNLFDFGDATTSGEGRARTTVAPQALFLMNSPFVLERAKGMAGRLAESSANESARVERAFLIAYGRPPRPAETSAALLYIAKLGWPSYCHVLLASSEALYVD